MDINNTNKYDEKMAERKELWIEIQKLDKTIEKNKLKRNLFTITFYTIVNTAISYLVCCGFDKSVDLKLFIEILIISIVFAGISFLVNAIVFSQLVNRGNNETAMLEKMEKRLSEIDDELSVM